MTVWARNDLASVNISEAHGGCGHTHTRPAPGGVPAAVWQFDECPPCEDYLRHDAHWSATPSEIPETYDETKVREDFEKRGAKDKDAILTLAIARLAGFDSSELPETLTRMISGVRQHVPAEMECPKGHGQPAGRKFCAECGSPMHGTAAKAAIAPVQLPVDMPSSGRLKDANKKSLQALCRAHGLDDSGTNADLVTRVSNAGLTINDLAKLAQPAAVAA
jgi:hypothetical protein